MAGDMTVWLGWYLNESPYEKVGKSRLIPPIAGHTMHLNESPYEKVGKFDQLGTLTRFNDTSMKVPTKK